MTSKIKVDNIADQDDNNIINESGDVITVGAAGDTVAVAGNIVKSNAYQAADGGSIISQSGTTITIGASGDTVSLASGASQSGFGRSGTVDWDTTPKTATFTAVSGDGFFCNTTGGAFTCNLPAGTAGSIVSLADYAGTWDSNNLTVSPNGSQKIGGASADIDLDTKGQSVTFVYVDDTQGWINTMDSTSNERANAFIVATGGTITTSGNFKIHTFTGPGTFTVTSAGAPTGSNTVDYLVVAGGGGGGGGLGGGGGAGGYRESGGTASGCYTVSPLGSSPSPVAALPVSAQAYPITVGGGGPGRTSPGATGGNGNPAVFSTITSTGGGGGGTVGTPPNNAGGSGGSGGGGAGQNPSSNPGAGNTPPVSPPQGNNGGVGNPSPTYFGGGGGGALANGNPGVPGCSTGGPGATSSINGTPTARGGGGSGGGDGPATAGAPGGGGASGAFSQGNGTAGTANTGGGGGGGAGGGPTGGDGAAGGSGIVIIRYKFQ